MTAARILARHYTPIGVAGRGGGMTPQIAPIGRTYRISSDSAWPLRNSKGQTFAEAKAERENKEKSK